MPSAKQTTTAIINIISRRGRKCQIGEQINSTEIEENRLKLN